MKIMVGMAAFFLTTLAGCSTMQMYSSPERLKEDRALVDQNYQVMVKTGNEFMDKLVYEFACHEFGKILPIKEKEPFTGRIEILFASTSNISSGNSAAAFNTATGTGGGWYTGSSGYAGGNTATPSAGASISSPTVFGWHKNTMFLTIKDSRGQRIWSANYNYKGGWELLGWNVNTAQEAAHLCIKEIARQMKQDFALE
jgi:hypothetical protein